jgi:hypothetical protein
VVYTKTSTEYYNIAKEFLHPFFGLGVAKNTVHKDSHLMDVILRIIKCTSKVKPRFQKYRISQTVCDYGSNYDK